MKIKNLLFFCLLPVMANAQTYSQDTGKVSELYVSSSGSFAIKLDGGFVQADADNQCSTVGSTGWAGHAAADPLLKSAVLTAKTSGQTVTVTIQGCEASGGWFKLMDLYVQ